MNRIVYLALFALVAVAAWLLIKPGPHRPPVEQENTVKTETPDSQPKPPVNVESPEQNDSPKDQLSPGNILSYGADPTGKIDSSTAIQKAVDQAVEPGGADVYIPRGVFLMTNSVVKDNFDKLVIRGAPGAQIDFRVDAAFKLGDHEVAREDENSEPYYVQSNVTAKNIIIEGLVFKPGDPGWNSADNTNRFSYSSPISLSAVENVVVRDCKFHDWDFSAIGLNAPSRDILVENSQFVSSQETKVSYGVRVFAFVEDARLDSYDSRSGLNSREAPKTYHQNVRIQNNHFAGTSHGIISWNVRDFEYTGNVFINPTTRTISLSHWNFDGLVERNFHKVEDNLETPLSTALIIGRGSQRIVVRNETFTGTMSGEGVNNKLKVLQVSGVNKDIAILDNIFNVRNAAATILIGPNAGAIIEGNYFLQAPITRSGFVLSDIYVNDSPASSPEYVQPGLEVRNNTSLRSTRFIVLNGSPANQVSAVKISDNTTYGNLKNGFLVTSSSSDGWKVQLDENVFNGEVSDVVKDFGSGKTDLRSVVAR